MGCVAQKKKVEKQIYRMETQIKKLVQQNEEMTNQINTMREQEQILSQLCEQRSERQRIDLTALTDELNSRFEKLRNDLKQIDIICEEQKQAKLKEMLEWKNLFDKLDNVSKNNLSQISEEDEY
ncbi:unnamed protein product (macronuclear) [Paramecium tetraurelia]|uniref:Uncharacterized protein n=1 Tax=Paramecium tetraurelia TaxID=5888 RepID=A0BS63_PARTE|nr:uncharacterized protein GSPATT00031611001 [Paramecium tetraurelia]CAK61380.1 unnamed protein product [Paramecium tetraurelia]|eukprot:XP_001428778.1 hypothetical protein (macronuclear) [Paramecium tetraurelia strain d4-2]